MCWSERKYYRYTTLNCIRMSTILYLPVQPATQSHSTFWCCTGIIIHNETFYVECCFFFITKYYKWLYNSLWMYAVILWVYSTNTGIKVCMPNNVDKGCDCCVMDHHVMSIYGCLASLSSPTVKLFFVRNLQQI